MVWWLGAIAVKKSTIYLAKTKERETGTSWNHLLLIIVILLLLLMGGGEAS
jgi:hypothetical protein